jgi:hypothetical protein
MEPILIHSVPREAFNKHRPISDLVRKQIEHFKHVEEKLPQDVRAKLPQHEIVTEDDAARYISSMTGHLLSGPRPKQAAKKIVAIKPPSPPRRPSPPLALAAAATPARKKSAATKKTAQKKQAPAARKSPSSKPKAKKTSPRQKTRRKK